MNLPYSMSLPSADLPEFADRLIFTLKSLKLNTTTGEQNQDNAGKWLIQQFEEDRERYNNLSVDDLLQIKFWLESRINQIAPSSTSLIAQMELSFLNGQLSRANSYLEFKARVLFIPDFESIKSNPELIQHLFDIAGDYSIYL